MASKRSSGLDFADRGGPTLDMHPDLMLNAGNPNLQRNKSERTRLQGLMRIPNRIGTSPVAGKNLTMKDRWDLWMINEGGKRLFFFTWLFLHGLVFLFGWFNYALKDNEVGARATFGVTFGELN